MPCFSFIAVSNTMSQISTAKFLLSLGQTPHPSVHTHCQYSSHFAGVENYILYTSCAALCWTASNSYTEGKLLLWQTLGFQELSHRCRLKFGEQEDDTGCTVRRRNSAQIETPSVDRELQFPFSYCMITNKYTTSDCQEVQLSFSAV